MMDEPSAPPPSKKRKAGADDAHEDRIVPEGPLCEHCGGAVPQMSLRVACLDGETLALTVPKLSRVREVKRAVGEARGVHADLLDLFQKGTEDALPDAERLPSLGVGDASVLFMLQRAG